jgi:hypothetical protein
MHMPAAVRACTAVASHPREAAEEDCEPKVANREIGVWHFVIENKGIE